jgi:Bacterial SH3 domain
MKRTLVLLILFFGLSLAFADTATVQIDTNVREKPTRSSSIVTTVSSGDEVELLSAKPRRGYYHIRTADGNEGWVLARNVQVDADDGNTTNPPPNPQDLFARLMAARKPTVGQPLVENGQEVCGPAGDAPDQSKQALNQNKNRTDTPDVASYVLIDWDSLSSLPSDRIQDFQGASVAVEGFLSHKINVENRGNGESTNCHLTGDDEVDWHMYLTKSPAQQISDAIIVETTPRTRPSHTWTVDGLTQFVDSDTRVRISGWLMYDFEHTGVIGTQRATVWEVHPVTRIEVQRNGQWVDLESAQ